MSLQLVERNVFSLIEPIVAQENCRLVDVELTSDMGMRVLRVYIDREGGVMLDDCSRVSGAIEDIIDVKECLSGTYNLEVSSPGIDRPLRTAEHFREALNRKIKVMTHDKIDGRQNYKGVLKEVFETQIVITVDQQDFKLPLAAIKKARLVLE